MGRIIIFTGKGGVGKSSVAAAHARQASLSGKKTLIVSTDMAHSLGDLFECELGREALEIAPKLWGLEIDPDYEMNHDFASMMTAFEQMFPMGDNDPEGNSSIEMLSMMPGIEELFSLLKIHAIYQEGLYDLIIVDCAPTGETLSLLKFPELVSWYMERLFPLGKAAMKVMRPVSKAL
ncbi:MAG: ArsA family ATPase, partial [Eubacterium sp.]